MFFSQPSLPRLSPFSEGGSNIILAVKDLFRVLVEVKIRCYKYRCGSILIRSQTPWKIFGDRTEVGKFRGGFFRRELQTMVAADCF